MNPELFMAVDLGTSFIKSAVYSLDGTMLASASEPVKDERPAPGVFLQKGEFLYEAVTNCVRKTAKALGDRAAQVAGIGFTGQMAGSMGVDENWNDVTTWSCSLDSRYIPFAERQRSRLGDLMFEKSGTSSPVMCAKYEWFRSAFPEEHKRIAKYVMLNGYIIGRMARLPISEAKIDNSLIAWTGLADVKHHTWSKEICRSLEIPEQMLPQITDCTQIGGYLHPDVAKELALPSGIPLIVGAGDKVSGCVGADVLHGGDMIFEAASYGAISCQVGDVRMDYEKRNYDVIGAVDRDSYYIHKYIQGSGIGIDWFIDTFVRNGGSKKEAFSRVEALCGGIGPGSEHMMAIGLLGGSSIPFDADIRGMFLGHTFHHHLGHFYHALLESFSYELALTLRSMTERYPELANKTIKLVGGGAKSTVWPQMLADVTGHPFALLDRDDAALWGAAILTATGVGAVDDIARFAGRFVQNDRIYTPDMAAYNVYQRYVDTYEPCLKTASGLCATLRRLP